MTATVIVSCYNQERYIAQCLDGILSQKTNFRFTIKVFDDASTDGTPTILRSYASQFPETVEIFLGDINLGANRNYLKAHNNAEGDVVFHCDGDDIMLPGKLQQQYDIFREYSDVNLVFHRALYFADDDSYQTTSGVPSIARDGLAFFDVKDLALWGTIAVHSAYAYRRTSRKVFTLDRSFMEWFFAMDSLLPTGRGVYLDAILVKYRCNPKGEAYLASKAGRKKAYLVYLDDLKYYFHHSPHLCHELYANFLFTALAMARTKNSIGLNYIRFILQRIRLFRPILLIKTYRMRKSVAPTIRNR